MTHDLVAGVALEEHQRRKWALDAVLFNPVEHYGGAWTEWFAVASGGARRGYSFCRLVQTGPWIYKVGKLSATANHIFLVNCK